MFGTFSWPGLQPAGENSGEARADQYRHDGARDLHRHDERQVDLRQGRDDRDRIRSARAGREIGGERVRALDEVQSVGEGAAERDQGEDRRRDPRQLTRGVGDHRAGEAQSDRPADQRVGRGQKPRRQRDREQMTRRKNHPRKHWRKQSSGGGFPFHADRGAPDYQRQRRQERAGREGGEPFRGRRSGRRDAERPRDDRRQEPDDCDPKILHDGDEPDVRAIGLGHQHHGGRSPRGGAPDRRGPRQNLPPRHEDAERGANAITASTPLRKTGHCRTISVIDAEPIAFAMRQPTTTPQERRTRPVFLPSRRTTRAARRRRSTRAAAPRAGRSAAGSKRRRGSRAGARPSSAPPAGRPA